MTSDPPRPTSADHRLAAQLAERSGDLLRRLRGSLASDTDEERRSLRDAGDRQSHDLLMTGLAGQLAAGDAVLSEEGTDDPVRLGARRVWIVDPLDGTREFGEVPRSDWAVHVALTIDGSPVAGAVALPALDLTLSTGTDLPTLGPIPSRPRLIVSRTRPQPAVSWLADQLDGELVQMGSAGAKAMAVVRGEAEIYAHTGGQYEWDSCAPVAVALAAGLHASRIDGSPLVYNRENPYLPDLVICRAELADAALSGLESFPG